MIIIKFKLIVKSALTYSVNYVLKKPLYNFPMRFIIFATIFFTVMALLSFYISRRFIRKVHFSKKTKNYFNIFLFINLFGVLGYLLVRYNPIVPNWLYFLFSIPIGIIFLLFIATIFYEVFSSLIKVSVKDEEETFSKKGLIFQLLL